MQLKLEWKSEALDCLAPVVQQLQSRELTQEMKLPEAMPDVGQVLAAWGQGILRGKQWQADSVSCTGGVMVWVLYAPEDGSAPRTLEGWVPFQLRWDLPEDTPEGVLRVECQAGMVDARSVSPRKLMLRVGVGVSVEAFAPMTARVRQPSEVPPSVELLKTVYPLTLIREAGEKAFLLDEELSLPEGSAAPERILCSTLSPRVTDEKVLSRRVVFRGVGKLHVLALSPEGKVESREFPVSFSQFDELAGEHSGEARVDFRLCVTSLEVEVSGGGLRLKCGLTAQYRITDRVPVELVEDAYSPGRDLALQWEKLETPVVLETRRETLSREIRLPSSGGTGVDLSALPALPVAERRGEGVELTFSGNVQLLSAGEDGTLSAASGRWEHRQNLTCHENARVFPSLPGAGEGTLLPGEGAVKLELPVSWTVTAREALPQVAALEVGEAKPAADGPSLILRRAGGERLWDIAKATGSTMSAIRQATGLEGEPAPNQMLLIPLGVDS